ncbi:response regulator transcription factor [Fimbriimonas ginsengisoli]|uniref:Two component transcriptional regulator, winged helix family n=1 Tax=Fimbriimonas ginsengisoli Gsoil 348 TaxID=661478 RepID=A0A068NL35_FIMGI|nr:response regulator transcription factor [Fimbriimonas ginsengisoli]AIE84186.1 two component transcriptional regulator, winged helix family [Fimbriimonas ginsengisoli Gsoil 348]
MNRDKVEVDGMTILLIEDDSAIADVIGRGLSAAGYLVKTAGDGAAGLELALGGSFGAVVLDLMLPKLSGFQVCESLRAAGVSTPVLMLTARDAVRDRVQGLNTGADDYLVKPFDFEELLARVRALLRRDKVNRGKVVRIAHLTLDTDAHAVWIDGQEVDLKPREYALLEALALNEGRVLTRDLIQDRIWDNEESFSNVVDVQIKRLRDKIERPHLPRLIQTVHGLGYSLRRPDYEAR